VDPIEEARIVAKLDIMLAKLDNIIQTCETQNQRIKNSAPASKQRTTAHASVHPYAKRDL